MYSIMGKEINQRKDKHRRPVSFNRLKGQYHKPACGMRGWKDEEIKIKVCSDISDIVRN